MTAVLSQGMPATEEYAVNTDLELQIEHVRPGEHLARLVKDSFVHCSLEDDGSSSRTVAMCA